MPTYGRDISTQRKARRLNCKPTGGPRAPTRRQGSRRPHPPRLAARTDRRGGRAEAIAVVKLGGFVEDKGGVVRDSQPGEIRVQLGRRPDPAPPPSRGKSLMNWVGGGRNGAASAATPQPDPIDMRLYLTRAPDDRSNRLQLMIVFEPLDGHALSHPTAWRDRCDTLFHDLRGYLMGK